MSIPTPTAEELAGKNEAGGKKPLRIDSYEAEQIKAKFSEFDPAKHTLEFKDEAFGARFNYKKGSLKLDASGAELGGDLGKQMAELEKQSDAIEKIRDSYKSLKDIPGADTSVIDRDLAKHERDFQRQVDKIGDKLRKELQRNAELEVKFAQGQTKITKEYMRAALKDEFTKAKGNAAEMAKLESKIEAFTSSLSSAADKHRDFVKDNITAIEDFAKDMEAKGIKVDLKKAEKSLVTVAGAEGKALANGEHAAANGAGKFGWKRGIGGAALIVDGIGTKMLPGMFSSSEEDKSKFGFMNAVEVAIGGLMLWSAFKAKNGKAADAIAKEAHFNLGA